MDRSRRRFLKTSGAISLGFLGLQTLIGRHGSVAPKAGEIPYGFGKLIADPVGLFDLPAGFSYQAFSRRGERMQDGLMVPAAHDGMAAFEGPEGMTLLVRNHELDPQQAELSPFGAGDNLWSGLDPARMYDPGNGQGPCCGGTSTLLFDTRTQEFRGHRMSLLGTSRNCAGGPTPWGSWVTCEETVDRAGDLCARDHGYCFEVPATLEDLPVAPEALVGMGRFNHEAIAIDPRSGAVYETEDREDSLIYRYLPEVPGQLSLGGRLQALMIEGSPCRDLRNWDNPGGVVSGEKMRVAWVDLEDIESPNDDLRYRGFEKGAARFARGEGMWSGNGCIYFACTTGGHAQKGQIWKYTPSRAEGSPGEKGESGILELFIEPNDGTLVENCDNVTVAPWGDLFLCEDGSDDNFLVGITPGGDIYKFGRNARDSSELAGVTFSPDGSTLFVNLQEIGVTLAITGPGFRSQV